MLKQRPPCTGRAKKKASLNRVKTSINELNLNSAFFSVTFGTVVTLKSEKKQCSVTAEPLTHNITLREKPSYPSIPSQSTQSHVHPYLSQRSAALFRRSQCFSAEQSPVFSLQKDFLTWRQALCYINISFFIYTPVPFSSFLMIMCLVKHAGPGKEEARIAPPSDGGHQGKL